MELPIVNLPGAEIWIEGVEWGDFLEAKFPGQDGDQFAQACVYDPGGPIAEDGPHLRTLVMLQKGERDAGSWWWKVDLDNGQEWLAVGRCDYTGWDCQSGLNWYHIQ